MFGSPELRSEIVELVTSYENRTRSEKDLDHYQLVQKKYLSVIDKIGLLSFPLRLLDKLGWGFGSRVEQYIQISQEDIDIESRIEKAARVYIKTYNGRQSKRFF